MLSKTTCLSPHSFPRTSSSFVNRIALTLRSEQHDHSRRRCSPIRTNSDLQINLALSVDSQQYTDLPRKQHVYARVHVMSIDARSVRRYLVIAFENAFVFVELLLKIFIIKILLNNIGQSCYLLLSSMPNSLYFAEKRAFFQ